MAEGGRGRSSTNPPVPFYSFSLGHQTLYPLPSTLPLLSHPQATPHCGQVPAYPSPPTPPPPPPVPASVTHHALAYIAHPAGSPDPPPPALPTPQVTPQERQHAKHLYYGILYGMGPIKLADELGVDAAKATELRNDFLHSLPGACGWPAPL